MLASKSIEQESDPRVSESAILFISFIAGVTVSIITVSILFFAVKKIESKLSAPVNIALTATR
jgi:hypothetical protein